MKTKGTKNKRIKLPHGDGSIYYIESRNRYAGQVTLMIDGDKLRKTVYGKTEKEVKDKIRELHIQAQAGNLHNPKKPKPLTIYDLADKMIEEARQLRACPEARACSGPCPCSGADAHTGPERG